MLKVLIVDDEALARRDLAERVRWERLNCTVIGFAANGKDALARMERLRPDIVLIDIKMPVMDGLEAISIAAGRGYECAFVVLSCFEDYPLVRNALRLGAVDYLLKHTCTDEELMDAVNRAKAHVEHRAQEKRLRRHIQKLLWRRILDCALTRQELEDWVASGFFSGEPSGYAVLEAYHAGSEEAIARRCRDCFDEALIWPGDQDAAYTILLTYSQRENGENEIQKLCQRIAQNDCGGSANIAFYAFDTISLWYLAYKRAKDSPDNSVGRNTQRALEFIRSHYAEHLTLETVSDAVGISRIYLCKVFKQDTGVSFSEWVKDYRLQKACQMLLNKNLRIYEIAEMVGFAGQSYFSAAFKRAFGVSPYEFREQERP